MMGAEAQVKERRNLECERAARPGRVSTEPLREEPPRSEELPGRGDARPRRQSENGRRGSSVQLQRPDHAERRSAGSRRRQHEEASMRLGVVRISVYRGAGRKIDGGTCRTRYYETDGAGTGLVGGMRRSFRDAVFAHPTTSGPPTRGSAASRVAGENASRPALVAQRYEVERTR